MGQLAAKAGQLLFMFGYEKVSALSMSQLSLFKLVKRSLNVTSRFYLRDAHKRNISTTMRLLSSSCDMDNSVIRTRIALPRDFDRVIDFMRKTYFKFEPTLVNIGLTCDDEPPTQLVKLMRDQVKKGLTIIAETRENCVVGAAVNVCSCPWEPDAMIEFAESCCDNGLTRDVIKFYARVTVEPKLWDRYCVNKIFECCHLAVDEEHRGRGIARRLVKESWYLARDCGYQVFRIDCTSIYTAKIAEGFGWDCVFSTSYISHVDSGGLVFKHIQEPHTEVRVFVDRPLTCKDYCASNPPNCKTIGSAPGAKKI